MLIEMKQLTEADLHRVRAAYADLKAKVLIVFGFEGCAVWGCVVWGCVVWGCAVGL